MSLSKNSRVLNTISVNWSLRPLSSALLCFGFLSRWLLVTPGLQLPGLKCSEKEEGDLSLNSSSWRLMAGHWLSLHWVPDPGPVPMARETQYAELWRIPTPLKHPWAGQSGRKSGYGQRGRGVLGIQLHYSFHFIFWYVGHRNATKSQNYTERKAQKSIPPCYSSPHPPMRLVGNQLHYFLDCSSCASFCKEKQIYANLIISLMSYIKDSRWYMLFCTWSFHFTVSPGNHSISTYRALPHIF